MRERVESELLKAETALSDAKTLKEGGGSDEAIINRLYYACFHAAQAALYAGGYDPTTHNAVVRLFGREFVNAGQVAKSSGRFLSEMRDLRNDADYGHESIEIDVEIDALIPRATEFVDEMDELLDS